MPNTPRPNETEILLSIGAAIAEAAGRGDTVAVVTWSPRGFSAGSAVRRHHHLPDDAAGFAAELYATLHAVDEAGCAEVLVERPPEDAAWDGVRDRLTRASHD